MLSLKICLYLESNFKLKMDTMTHPCYALLDGHSEVLLFPRKIVLNGGTQAPHPFGIAVFENHVFFTDWTKMGVVRANRFNGSNPALLYRTAMRPGDVVVSHPVLQPVGKETLSSLA